MVWKNNSLSRQLTCLTFGLMAVKLHQFSSAPKAISLFAGAGGCSLGFKQAGFNVIFATDWDQSAVETYRSNFPETAVVCGDIGEIDFVGLMDDLGLVAGELEVLIGGPPCQGFSTAGPRFWDDPRNQLLKEYVRALATIQPKWFLMENVEGLLTSNGGDYVAEAVKAFVDLGYQVRLEKVYAQEYGIPQRRKRVIIVGNRLGIDFAFPKPTTVSHGKIYRNAEVTIGHALLGLPVPGTENVPATYTVKLREAGWVSCLMSRSGMVMDHFSPPIEELQLKRISLLCPGQSMKDLPEALQHASFKRRANRRVMDGTPSEKRGGAPSCIRRLPENEPSLTITGAAIREFVHPDQNRYLTLRECARIQTFPDEFMFYGSISDRIQQIGNAIPPMLALSFARMILEMGFQRNADAGIGALLGYVLTKSTGQSPQLQATAQKLERLRIGKPLQLSLF